MEKCKSSFVMFFILLLVLGTCDSEEKEILNGVVGSTVTFPASVTERGFFILGRTIIAFVSNGVFEIESNIYLNRLHWSSSGHITLSDLKKNDSGSYSIDSKKPTALTKVYELKVYDKVSDPVVSCLNVSESSFFLHCSVKQTEKIKLNWLKGDQSVNSSNSRELLLTAPRLENNTECKCVAQNPVQTKSITVDVTTVCKIYETRLSDDTDAETFHVYIIVGFIVVIIVFMSICLAFVWFWKRKRDKSTSSLPPQESVHYTQRNQSIQINQPLLPGPSPRSNPSYPGECASGELVERGTSALSNGTESVSLAIPIDGSELRDHEVAPSPPHSKGSSLGPALVCPAPAFRSSVSSTSDRVLCPRLVLRTHSL